MNLRAFHPKNPDFDLPASDIALLSPVQDPTTSQGSTFVLVLAVIRLPIPHRKVPIVPIFKIDAFPDETSLTTENIIKRALFPHFEMELFGKPFPFYWIGQGGYIINIPSLTDIEITENIIPQTDVIHKVTLFFKNQKFPNSPNATFSHIFLTQEEFPSRPLREQLLEAIEHYQSTRLSFSRKIPE